MKRGRGPSPLDAKPPPKRPRVKYTGLERYEKIDRVGEGTYGVVYKARDRNNSSFVALKKVRHISTEKEGFPLTSIREIKILKNLTHPNIVRLVEVVTSRRTGNVFMVFEYYEHDIASLLDRMKRPFSESEVKCIMLQLLKAIKHIHKFSILHRDLKLSNLLMNNAGRIVLADFGLARLFSDPLEDYTPKVVTLWYRSPELLFGVRKYHSGVDMWAAGCIMGELILHRPLLPGKTELDQVELIFKLLGVPNDRIWPGFSRLSNVKSRHFELAFKGEYKYNEIQTRFAQYSNNFLHILKSLLAFDPAKRIRARDAVKHPYFEEKPFPKAQELMPTFPHQTSSTSQSVKYH